MKREIMPELLRKAEEVAKIFSNPARPYNQAGEIFIMQKVNILSENTAAVSYLKSSGKLALAFFYYCKGNGGYWNYFFPSDSHLFGLRQFEEFKRKIEDNNLEVEICNQKDK